MASTNFSAIQLSTILDSSSAPQLFRLSTILKLIRLSTILALVRLYFPAAIQWFRPVALDLNRYLFRIQDLVILNKGCKLASTVRKGRLPSMDMFDQPIPWRSRIDWWLSWKGTSTLLHHDIGFESILSG
ncbi:hypothetical protein PGT21_002408 [Puccinia graminis f. sp. tritici]|uniref:Uncharacterized protein n=1 Tax=Puccinia graminis f. sp. tritici TaxID=56615 RepID=A0A5B0LSJ8_PUCGR|nr:hypothetical protein PGT21_002408 [Puccinia graminis f. sp. tritici]